MPVAASEILFNIALIDRSPGGMSYLANNPFLRYASCEELADKDACNVRLR